MGEGGRWMSIKYIDYPTRLFSILVDLDSWIILVGTLATGYQRLSSCQSPLTLAIYLFIAPGVWEDRKGHLPGGIIASGSMVLKRFRILHGVGITAVFLCDNQRRWLGEFCPTDHLIDCPNYDVEGMRYVCDGRPKGSKWPRKFEYLESGMRGSFWSIVMKESGRFVINTTWALRGSRFEIKSLGYN